MNDSQQALVECSSCGQRVSGEQSLEIHQQESCKERKTRRDQEKHNQERLREQTGKTEWICGACRAAFTRKDAWKRRDVVQPVQARTLQTIQSPKAPQQTMLAKESSKKDQREDKGAQEENPEDEAQLVKLIARLTLQHEFERMATARAENIASEFEASSETMVAMEASKTAYEAEGEKARKISGDQYKGHPEGKKPDAMFRMLAFRLATLEENQRMALDTAVAALMEHQDLAQRALQTVLNTGNQAENDRDMRASTSETKTVRNPAYDGSWQGQLIRSSCKQ